MLPLSCFLLFLDVFAFPPSTLPLDLDMVSVVFCVFMMSLFGRDYEGGDGGWGRGDMDNRVKEGCSLP